MRFTDNMKYPQPSLTFIDSDAKHKFLNRISQFCKWRRVV